MEGPLTHDHVKAAHVYDPDRPDDALWIRAVRSCGQVPDKILPCCCLLLCTANNLTRRTQVIRRLMTRDLRGELSPSSSFQHPLYGDQGKVREICAVRVPRRVYLRR